eukprot:scaffold8786_cov16-Tisochrysis_lutea.AAC.1
MSGDGRAYSKGQPTCTVKPLTRHNEQAEVSSLSPKQYLLGNETLLWPTAARHIPQVPAKPILAGK